MKLPYGDNTDIKQIRNKLETYALNFGHTNGKHKARLFQSKLGITTKKQDILISKLREIAACSDQFEFMGSDQYGDRYVVIFTLTTTTGTSQILSAWMLHPGETSPRLTSVYPIRN